jgi:predicted TIM-barrel fold metal-dependent hydrolase
MYLHRCSPPTPSPAAEHPGADVRSGAHQVRERGRTLTVDLHCHSFVTEVEQLVKDRPEKRAEPIALSHLIFGGVFDKHPGLKILAAHGGGYLPSYIGRSDHAYAARPDARTMKRAPSEYLRQIYFDSLVYTASGLGHLIDQVGSSQVVVGTDYPFDMGSYDVQGLVTDVPGLSEAERAAILGGNAARLIGLKS